MRLLVTAGNTMVPIDKVRAITNVFTGRTGSLIALAAHDRGHDVALVTSHPETLAELRSPPPAERWQTLPYRTFDDLNELLGRQITAGNFDAVVHCAAVSDYRAAGIYAPTEDTRFDPATGIWLGAPAPRLLDRAAGKVKSDEKELWVRLERTPKLIDLIRTAWSFRGVLVKFKLEVDRSDAELLDIAERSRRESDADLMVANTLEGAGAWAYLGGRDGEYRRLDRAVLAERLLESIERLHREGRR